MQKSELSWFNYIYAIRERGYTLGQRDTVGLERILNLDQHVNTVFSNCQPWIYLLDYTSGKYLFISRSVELMMGYRPDYFMDGGLGHVMDRYQTTHLRLFNEEIFPDRLALLKKIPVQEHRSCVFSYSFQFKNKQGELLHLLQRNCFIQSDAGGNPLLSFGMIINVTHHSPQNPVIQVVEKVSDQIAGTGSSILLKKHYFLKKEDCVFSSRELEILKWTIEGLTHKEIASKLFISDGTVLLHRKNMLKKSNTRNAAELVGYAFRNHLA